jgi:2'-5' RNA ligase
VHLTLKFLGDVPASQVELIQEGMASAIKGQSAMALEIQGLGCFPSVRKPRIIWAGLGGDLAALQGLHQAIEEHIAPLGYPTEARPFQAHITLGRVKSSHPSTLATIGRAVQVMPPPTIGHWTCEQISLMQSHLSPQGANYEALARVAFD